VPDKPSQSRRVIGLTIDGDRVVPVDSETTKPCRAAFLQPVDLIENVVDRPMFLRSFRGYGPHISCAIVQNRVSSGGWCSAQEWRLRGSHSFSPSRGT